MTYLAGLLSSSLLGPGLAHGQAGDPQLLTIPPSTLIVGMAGFGIFAAITIVSNVYSNETTTWWTTGIFVAFAAMAVPMILDYFRARRGIETREERDHGLASAASACRSSRDQVDSAGAVVARQLVEGGPLPDKAALDAHHTAEAVSGGVDYLLTWIFKHLANAVLRARTEKFCRSHGFEPCILCTPEELSEEWTHAAR